MNFEDTVGLIARIFTQDRWNRIADEEVIAVCFYKGGNKDTYIVLFERSEFDNMKRRVVDWGLNSDLDLRLRDADIIIERAIRQMVKSQS